MARKHSHRKPSLLWPLLLIAIGIILLLSNLGILPSDTINLLWRFWPLIFIIMGLEALLGRRSRIGKVIASILTLLLIGGAFGFILIAQYVPEYIQQLKANPIKSETIQLLREDIQTAKITIDWSSGPARLYALSDSNYLIDGHIDYYGNLVFEVNSQASQAEVFLDTKINSVFLTFNTPRTQQTKWDIGLHPAVALDLELDASSGSSVYDLSGLQIQTLQVDASSGPLEIILPEAGRIEKGFIDGASGPIDLILPETIEVQLTLETGSGPFIPTSRLQLHPTGGDEDTQVWVTKNYPTQHYINLQIDQGSGSITIQDKKE